MSGSGINNLIRQLEILNSIENPGPLTLCPHLQEIQEFLSRWSKPSSPTLPLNQWTRVSQTQAGLLTTEALQFNQALKLAGLSQKLFSFLGKIAKIAGTETALHTHSDEESEELLEQLFEHFSKLSPYLIHGIFNPLYIQDELNRDDRQALIIADGFDTNYPALQKLLIELNHDLIPGIASQFPPLDYLLLTLLRLRAWAGISKIIHTLKISEPRTPALAESAITAGDGSEGTLNSEYLSSLIQQIALEPDYENFSERLGLLAYLEKNYPAEFLSAIEKTRAEGPEDSQDLKDIIELQKRARIVNNFAALLINPAHGHTLFRSMIIERTGAIGAIRNQFHRLSIKLKNNLGRANSDISAQISLIMQALDAMDNKEGRTIDDDSDRANLLRQLFTHLFTNPADPSKPFGKIPEDKNLATHIKYVLEILGSVKFVIDGNNQGFQPDLHTHLETSLETSLEHSLDQEMPEQPARMISLENKKSLKQQIPIFMTQWLSQDWLNKSPDNLKIQQDLKSNFKEFLYLLTYGSESQKDLRLDICFFISSYLIAAICNAAWPHKKSNTQKFTTGLYEFLDLVNQLPKAPSQHRRPDEDFTLFKDLLSQLLNQREPGATEHRTSTILCGYLKSRHQASYHQVQQALACMGCQSEDFADLSTSPALDITSTSIASTLMDAPRKESHLSRSYSQRYLYQEFPAYLQQKRDSLFGYLTSCLKMNVVSGNSSYKLNFKALSQEAIFLMVDQNLDQKPGIASSIIQALEDLAKPTFTTEICGHGEERFDLLKPDVKKELLADIKKQKISSFVFDLIFCYANSPEILDLLKPLLAQLFLQRRLDLESFMQESAQLFSLLPNLALEKIGLALQVLDQAEIYSPGRYTQFLKDQIFEKNFLLVSLIFTLRPALRNQLDRPGAPYLLKQIEKAEAEAEAEAEAPTADQLLLLLQMEEGIFPRQAFSSGFFKLQEFKKYARHLIQELLEDPKDLEIFRAAFPKLKIGHAKYKTLRENLLQARTQQDALDYLIQDLENPSSDFKFKGARHLAILDLLGIPREKLEGTEADLLLCSLPSLLSLLKATKNHLFLQSVILPTETEMHASAGAGSSVGSSTDPIGLISPTSSSLSLLEPQKDPLVIQWKSKILKASQQKITTMPDEGLQLLRRLRYEALLYPDQTRSTQRLSEIKLDVLTPSQWGMMYLLARNTNFTQVTAIFSKDFSPTALAVLVQVDAFHKHFEDLTQPLEKDISKQAEETLSTSRWHKKSRDLIQRFESELSDAPPASRLRKLAFANLTQALIPQDQRWQLLDALGKSGASTRKGNQRATLMRKTLNAIDDLSKTHLYVGAAFNLLRLIHPMATMEKKFKVGQVLETYAATIQNFEAFIQTAELLTQAGSTCAISNYQTFFEILSAVWSALLDPENPDHQPLIELEAQDPGLIHNQFMRPEIYEEFKKIRAHYFSVEDFPADQNQLSPDQARVILLTHLIWLAVKTKNNYFFENLFNLANETLGAPTGAKEFLHCLYFSHPIPMTAQEFAEHQAFFQPLFINLCQNSLTPESLITNWLSAGNNFIQAHFKNIEIWRMASRLDQSNPEIYLVPERLAHELRSPTAEVDSFYSIVLQPFCTALQTWAMTAVPDSERPNLNQVVRDARNIGISSPGSVFQSALWRNIESTENSSFAPSLSDTLENRGIYLAQRTLLLLARAICQDPAGRTRGSPLHRGSEGEGESSEFQIRITLLKSLMTHEYWTRDLSLELVALEFKSDSEIKLGHPASFYLQEHLEINSVSFKKLIQRWLDQNPLKSFSHSARDRQKFFEQTLLKDLCTDCVQGQKTDLLFQLLALPRMGLFFDFPERVDLTDHSRASLNKTDHFLVLIFGYLLESAASMKTPPASAGASAGTSSEIEIETSTDHATLQWLLENTKKHYQKADLDQDLKFWIPVFSNYLVMKPYLKSPACSLLLILALLTQSTEVVSSMSFNQHPVCHLIPSMLANPDHVLRRFAEFLVQPAHANQLRARLLEKKLDWIDRHITHDQSYDLQEKIREAPLSVLKFLHLVVDSVFTTKNISNDRAQILLDFIQENGFVLPSDIPTGVCLPNRENQLKVFWEALAYYIPLFSPSELVLASLPEIQPNPHSTPEILITETIGPDGVLEIFISEQLETRPHTAVKPKDPKKQLGLLERLHKKERLHVRPVKLYSSDDDSDSDTYLEMADVSTHKTRHESLTDGPPPPANQPGKSSTVLLNHHKPAGHTTVNKSAVPKGNGAGAGTGWMGPVESDSSSDDDGVGNDAL